MITIGVYNHKGGVGKTTVSVNLATALATEFEKRVLVLDVDEQCDCTDWLLAGNKSDDMLRVTNYLNYVYADELKEKNGYEDKNATNDVRKLIRHPVYEVKKKTKTFENIGVIPSGKGYKYYPIENFKVVKDMLAQVSSDYDYCIIDMPADLSDMTEVAMIACNYILCVASTDANSAKNWTELNNEIKKIRKNEWNLSLKLLGIVLNGCETFSFSKELIGLMEKNLKQYLFDTRIPRAGVVGKSYSYKRPLTIYYPKMPSTRLFVKMAKEVIEKTKGR